jgi:hypothetical protein
MRVFISGKVTALGGVSGDFINTLAAVHSLRSTNYQEREVATSFLPIFI